MKTLRLGPISTGISVQVPAQRRAQIRAQMPLQMLASTQRHARRSPRSKQCRNISQAVRSFLRQGLLDFVFLFVLLFAASQSFAKLPGEVTNYLEQRKTCDHWSNEEGYDKERSADINWFICKTCSGTDARLRQLKQKYRSHEDVMQTLRPLDPDTEPSAAQTRRQCAHVRKPHWLKNKESR